MTSSTAIVLASIVPFTSFVASFGKRIDALPLHALERILDCGRWHGVSINLADNRPYDCGFAYMDGEANDELERVESIANEYEYESAMARHSARISATEDACLALAQARADRLRFDALVERIGLTEACRLQRLQRVGVVQMQDEQDEPCPIQRMERRAEFVMDSRMSGTPIDWDEFSSI